MTKTFTALTYDQAIVALVAYDAVFSEILKGVSADEIEEYFACGEANARAAYNLVKRGPDVDLPRAGADAWTPEARLTIIAQIANQIARKNLVDWRHDLFRIIMLCEASSSFLQDNRPNFPEIETLNEVPGEA